jgi:hypothetical protein
MVAGSALFVKRELWELLAECPTYRGVWPDAEGAMLETEHWYEDTWLCYHAHAHGFSSVYFGQATMIHKWHGASPKGGEVDKKMQGSRKLFRETCDAHSIPHD